MTDGTVSIQSLSDLIDFEGGDAFDWDPSALADWPNIAPGTAPVSPAWLPVREGIQAS